METKKTALVIMAAGIGSRFGGGIKQLEPVDDYGHIIMDYSIHDAIEAGFNKIVFIIRHDIEEDFKNIIGNRIEEICTAAEVEVAYAFQAMDAIPEGFSVPAGRTKPWGTGQAVLAAKDVIDMPFAVINADDYYGSKAFKLIYDYLMSHEDDEKFRYAMVGYILKNTLTENGHVARGICQVYENGYLADIHERTHIEKTENGAAYTEDGGETWTQVSPDSLVSMNMWGFSASMLQMLKEKFPDFLEENLKTNPLKCEFFLPFVVDELLEEKRATVQVLKTEDRWHGVTYQEDKQTVVNAIQQLKNKGLYPTNLW